MKNTPNMENTGYLREVGGERTSSSDSDYEPRAEKKARVGSSGSKTVMYGMLERDEKKRVKEKVESYIRANEKVGFKELTKGFLKNEGYNVSTSTMHKTYWNLRKKGLVGERKVEHKKVIEGEEGRGVKRKEVEDKGMDKKSDFNRRVYVRIDDAVVERVRGYLKGIAASEDGKKLEDVKVQEIVSLLESEGMSAPSRSALGSRIKRMKKEINSGMVLNRNRGELSSVCEEKAMEDSCVGMECLEEEWGCWVEVVDVENNEVNVDSDCDFDTNVFFA